MLWFTRRPPESERFFTRYAELTGLDAGWRDRMEPLHLRELLCQVAHGDGQWGAPAAIRRILDPFRVHLAPG